MENNGIITNWLEFLTLITEDKRLNVWHIGLLIAVIKLANMQNEKDFIRVSRSKLMYYSHVKNITTYHKYFKQLQDFGYIKYIPSYHPGYKSTIELNDKIFIDEKYRRTLSSFRELHLKPSNLT